MGEDLATRAVVIIDQNTMADLRAFAQTSGVPHPTLAFLLPPSWTRRKMPTCTSCHNSSNDIEAVQLRSSEWKITDRPI